MEGRSKDSEQGLVAKSQPLRSCGPSSSTSVFWLPYSHLGLVGLLRVVFNFLSFWVLGWGPYRKNREINKRKTTNKLVIHWNKQELLIEEVAQDSSLCAC